MAVFKASSKASRASEAPTSEASAPKQPKPSQGKATKSSKASRVSAVSGPFGAAVADLRAKRYPYALVFSVVSWLVVAITLFFSQVGAPTTTIDNASEAAVQGTGGQIAPTAQDQWFVPLLPWFGIIVVIGAVALFVGVGWARLVLAVLGIIMVVGLAEAQEQIPAVVVAVFTVIGAVLSLVLPSHRYLAGVEDTTDTADVSGQNASGGAIT